MRTKAKSSILRYHPVESTIIPPHGMEPMPLHISSNQYGMNMTSEKAPPQHGNTLSALSASLSAAPMQMRPMSGLLGPASGQIAINQAHVMDLNAQS